MENNNGTFAYYAFISHSHRDAKWATWIQEALERYRLPSAVRKAVRKPLPKRLAPVFRDVTDLGTGQLVEGLHRELENSRFLIVICSPDSARPNAEGKHYVNHEIEYFAGLGRGDRVIPVIVRGTPEEAFCPKIRELDLLAIDATKASRARVLNDIVAKILSLRPDELWQREKRRQMMRKIELSVFGAVAGLFVAVAGLFAWDAMRHVENYYADYVDSYGLPEGIFPLKKEELRGRHAHYRFEYEGIRHGKSIHADSSNWSFVRLFGFRRVLRRVVNANSRGCVRDESSPEHYGRAPILEFEYQDKDWILCQVVCRAIGGKLLQRQILSKFNDVVNGAVALKGEEASMSIMDIADTTGDWVGLFTDVRILAGVQTSKSRIAQYQLERDERGRWVKKWFIDSTGNMRIADNNGICGFLRKLDEIGRQTKLWYLDGNGNCCENKNGVAGIRFHYDGQNIVQSEYFNVSEAPTLGPWGYVICVDEYDSFGNNTGSRFCDAETNMVACADGYASGSVRYNDCGDISSMAFYGLNGLPCLCNDGYAKCCFEYDANGNQTTILFYDEDGKLTYFDDSNYAGEISEYDASGRVVKQWWVGLDGQRVPIAEGIFEYHYEYDGHGNQIGTNFHGKDGALVLCRNGFAGWKAEYNGRGLMTGKTWIGTDGQSILTRGGYARCEVDYDENGNVAKIRHYDVDGNEVNER